MGAAACTHTPTTTAAPAAGKGGPSQFLRTFKVSEPQSPTSLAHGGRHGWLHVILSARRRRGPPGVPPAHAPALAPAPAAPPAPAAAPTRELAAAAAVPRVWRRVHAPAQLAAACGRRAQVAAALPRVPPQRPVALHGRPPRGTRAALGGPPAHAPAPPAAPVVPGRARALVVPAATAAAVPTPATAAAAAAAPVRPRIAAVRAVARRAGRAAAAAADLCGARAGAQPHAVADRAERAVRRLQRCALQLCARRGLQQMPRTYIRVLPTCGALHLLQAFSPSNSRL